MSRDQPQLLEGSYISTSRHEMCSRVFHYTGSKTYRHGVLHLTHMCRTSGHAHPEGLSGASKELQHVICTSSLPGRYQSFCMLSYTTRVLLQPARSMPGNSLFHHIAQAPWSQLTHTQAEKVLKICTAPVLGWWEDAPGKAQLGGSPRVAHRPTAASALERRLFCSSLPALIHFLMDLGGSVPRDAQREETYYLAIQQGGHGTFSALAERRFKKSTVSSLQDSAHTERG